MKNYVNIVSLYNNEKERNIGFLSGLYDNKHLLKEKILSVGKGIIDNEAVIKGKKIMIKPNWVLDDRKQNDNICLRTNESVILVVLELILDQHPASIIIGDSPVQSCYWAKMLSNEFLSITNELSNQNNIPILIKDFRRVIFNSDIYNKERNPISDYLIFDLGKDSNLEPITSDKNNFRVTSYDPERLTQAHRKGVHKYCITKELFEADVVISMPKIKTHQKTGITGALKNLVGVNGDKDYLPHHRLGGTGFGGDCYPGKNLFRLAAEYLLDIANHRQGELVYKLLICFAAVIWKLSIPQKVHNLTAGWHGNDTTWRMVMDLNNIAVFGKADGTISSTPQRQLYSLCDGIIGGQGNGPLVPEPLPLGFVSFTNSSELNDLCMGTLMGFEIEKIPLLKFALKKIESDENSVIFNGESISMKELKNYSVLTTAPPGWVEYLKP